MTTVPAPAHQSFPVFATTAHLLVTEPKVLPWALELLRADLAAVDAACSRFRPTSELSRANATAGTGRAVAVGSVLAEALTVAWRAAEDSGGLVDPTVCTSVTAPVPGYRTVDWDPVQRRLRMPVGVELDLGATAKAWAADRAARLIAEATGCGVLVNLGGDLSAAGTAPEGGWRVAVSDDHRAPQPDSPVVSVRSGGLATSGTAVHTRSRDDRRVHHIVDPRTGRDPQPCWRTVTVAATTCVAAGTAATAALILGPEAPSMLRQAGLPARLVHENGDVVRVCGWPTDLPAPWRGAA